MRDIPYEKTDIGAKRGPRQGKHWWHAIAESLSSTKTSNCTTWIPVLRLYKFRARRVMWYFDNVFRPTNHLSFYQNTFGVSLFGLFLRFRPGDVYIFSFPWNIGDVKWNISRAYIPRITTKSSNLYPQGWRDACTPSRFVPRNSRIILLYLGLSVCWEYDGLRKR